MLLQREFYSKYIQASNGTISTTSKDYLMHLQVLNGIGMTNQLSLSAFIGLCSAALHKPAISSMAILGSLSISGSIIKVEELANVLQVCLHSGAKKVLLPITSAVDMATVPPELMGKFAQPIRIFRYAPGRGNQYARQFLKGYTGFL